MKDYQKEFIEFALEKQVLKFGELLTLAKHSIREIIDVQKQALA